MIIRHRLPTMINWAFVATVSLSTLMILELIYTGLSYWIDSQSLNHLNMQKKSLLLQQYQNNRLSEYKTLFETTLARLNRHMSENQISLIIRDMANQSGVELTSLQPLIKQNIAGFNETPVNIQVRGNYQQLASLIRDIETSEILLIIDTIAISRDRDGNIISDLSIQAISYE